MREVLRFSDFRGSCTDEVYRPRFRRSDSKFTLVDHGEPVVGLFHDALHADGPAALINIEKLPDVIAVAAGRRQNPLSTGSPPS